MKRALKQRISILLVLAMILPGTPVFAADSQAVGNSEDILQGQETDGETSQLLVQEQETGGETSQLLSQEQETDGEDPDSIANKSIGDYTARDDFEAEAEAALLEDPDGVSQYTIKYVRENGVTLSDDAQAAIAAAGNSNISLGDDGTVTQVFDAGSEEVLAPLVYKKTGMQADPDRSWKLTYTYSYNASIYEGSPDWRTSTETKYFGPDAKVKDLQQYASGGKIELYPNWVAAKYNVIWDETSFKGAANPNISVQTYSAGQSLSLKPVTDNVSGFLFEGYSFRAGNTEKEAVRSGNNWVIDTRDIEGDITVYARWSVTATVSVSEIKDIRVTYGIGNDELIKKFKENTTLDIWTKEEIGEEETNRIIECAWKGAVWFYAPGDDEKAVVTENTTLADLRKNTVWKEIKADTKEMDAGDYYLVLAFDESSFDTNTSALSAGALFRGRLTIDRRPLILKLYDSTGTSDVVSIPFKKYQPIKPSELFSAKVFDAATLDFCADLKEFSVLSENSALRIYRWGDKCNLSPQPRSNPGIRFYISANAIRWNELKMVDAQGNVLNCNNYTTKTRSNTVDVATYDGSEGNLQLGDGYYSDEFYFPSDEFIDTLTEREFAEDFVNVYQAKRLVEDYQNMKVALLPDSYVKTPEERTKEFERIFTEGLSISEQMKAIAAKNPTDLYAGKKLYVAVSHNSLGFSSADQNDYYLVIRKQPVIYSNAEEIKGLKGKGIIREYGGVNRYGGYGAKLNIGIIDREGHPILKENGTVKTVKDYSASYSWAGADYQAEKLQAVSSWLNGTYRSYMEIKLGKYGESGQVPYNYGNKQIELSFSYLRDRGLFTNFTPYWDQKYSVYHIADSRNVSFSDFEGNKLRDDPILVEVTQDKDGRNILSFEVASFKGFDGTDKSTKDVKWYCTDADGKMTCIPEAAVTPLAKEGTTDVFTGAKFTLDKDFYGDAIKLCAKTDTAKEGEFWIKPINPVFYTGVKMVGRQEKLKMGSALYNCSVDIRVMSGTGEQAKELVWNTDYTMTYSNNTNAGTAQVKVVGKGDYKGKKATATFAILPAKFDNAAFVTEKKKTIEFTGKSIDSSMTGTSYFKVYLSYDGKTQVSRTEYTPKVVEYKIADDGTILAKDSLEEYNKYDRNIRYFDVYAVASKDGNFLKGDTCGEDLKVGENLYEHMDRVDVIGTRRGGVKLSYFGLRTAIDYNSKATLKNFADLGKKTVYVKYNKTSGSEKIYLTDKRLKVELYKVLDDGTREFICSGADYDKVKLPGSGDYVLRIGPKYYDEKGNTIQGGSLYSVGVYSTLEVKLKMRGLKLSSTVVKVDKASKTLTLDPEGTVLQLDINPKRKAYFDPAKVLLCYTGIKNGSYTVGEGDEELEFYDGSTLKTAIPLMRNGKQLTLADVCVDGVYSINLAEFTDSFGNSLNAVGTGAIVFVSNGGKFYGSYSSNYTIKNKK